MTIFHRIPKNPSCGQLEELIAKLQRISGRDTVILSLARKTGAKFFSESSISQLIADLSERAGSLVLRDTYNSWSDSRFLSKIDGVSALVYSSLSDSTRLENIKKISAPESLFRSLESKLMVSGILENKGPTRTLIAIDPHYSTPVELGGPYLKKNYFHTIFRQMLHQYKHGLDKKSVDRHKAEHELVNFVYETFQNTVEHGRYSSVNDIIQGIRYFRVHVYIGNSVDGLVRRASGFPELGTFLSRPRTRSSEKRFIELSVADAGQGIASHYLNSRPGVQSDVYDRERILQELIGGNLSSKRSMSGVGWGLPNALAALKELNAFVSLRTEEFWLYRDFTDSLRSPSLGRYLYPVKGVNSLARVGGTQFNVLIDFPI